jgi:hypothetical protein
MCLDADKRGALALRCRQLAASEARLARALVDFDLDAVGLGRALDIIPSAVGVSRGETSGGLTNNSCSTEDV